MYRITPWEVSGKVDYNKIIKDFGVSKIDDNLLNKLSKYTKDLHIFLRRGIFFAHRDFDKILDDYLKGKEFFLYTGRGPSAGMHFGHLIPLMFTKWLQDKFNTEVYIQITDDEKYLVKKLDEKKLEETTRDNIQDILAIGFKEGKTYIIQNSKHIKYLYKLSIKISKYITFSTMKSIFGFTNSSNPGIIFFPCVQSSVCFLPSELKNKKLNCLIPAAIDQDPYWRGIAREVATKLGYPKPAQIHSKFLPGLTGDKMSSSIKESAIYTSDNEEEIKKKIWNSITGGAKTLKEQKEKGGNPNICKVYQYLYYLFEEDDKKIDEIYYKCKNGELVCGDCKSYLADKINKLLKKHNQNKKKVKIDKYMIDNLK